LIFILISLVTFFLLNSLFFELSSDDKEEFERLGKPDILSSNNFKMTSSMFAAIKVIFTFPITRLQSKRVIRSYVYVKISFLLQLAALILLISKS
jgi:hypothetical protein